MLALPVAEGYQPVRQIRMSTEMPVQAVRDTSVLVEEVVLALAECLKVADGDLRIDLSTKEEFQQKLNADRAWVRWFGEPLSEHHTPFSSNRINVAVSSPGCPTG